MRDSTTDTFGRTLTDAYNTSRTSYKEFFKDIARRYGMGMVELREDTVAPASWEKKARKCITGIFVTDGRIFEVYHWFGRKGIFVKY